MTFEPILLDDVELVSVLAPEEWGPISAKIIHYIVSDFCLPIKLMVNNKIVGIGACILHHDVAWLGHIIVDKNERGKNYGKTITLELIRIAQSRGCRSIQLIATDMGAPLYRKIGFKESTNYLFFEALRPALTYLPDEHIHSYKPEYLDTILNIDLTVSGEYRMDELWPHLNSSFVYLSSDKVLGYYLPTLGEGLIVAKDSTAGLALLQFHISSGSSLVLPQNNIDATSFLYDAGYTAYRSAKRMYLGEDIPVKFSAIYNRIGGNIG